MSSKNLEHEINEGLSTLAIDYVIAARIIKYLWQDFDQTDAYKLGIIDNNGDKLKDPETVEEKAAYSPFIRLILNLKRLISKVPGGKSKLGSMIAAYALMRECVDDKNAIILDSLITQISEGSTLDDAVKYTLNNHLKEDGVPVCSTAGATSPSTGGYDKPMNTGPKKKSLTSKIIKRKVQ